MPCAVVVVVYRSIRSGCCVGEGDVELCRSRSRRKPSATERGMGNHGSSLGLLFPEPKELSIAEVEAWIDSNLASLPEGLQSMPRSDLSLRLISIQNCMRLPDQEKEANQHDLPHARFQRTDQWLPVYSWLETLDKDEVVKSKEISDWLTENPKVQEQLCSRHSRYHLMHYIKKCHLKILKRREKRKVPEQPDKDTSLKVQKDVPMKHSAPVPCGSVNNIPKDSELYATKRNEAYRKYEILLALEKLLCPGLPKRPDTKQ